MLGLPPITLRLRGRKLAGRLAFVVLLIGVIALGAGAGLLFVYSNDLPEIRALEDYRPNVVTELFADDGQEIGTFSLQRRILLSWEQIPQTLKDAITSTEDQHFFEHWGVDLPRVVEAAWRNAMRRRIRGRREHAHDAACRRPIFGSLGPQLPAKDPGDVAGHADRTQLHQAADFHDVREPGVSGAWQLRLRGGLGILLQ